MKRTLLLLCVLLLFLNCGAYTISQYTKTFYDASRNRNIQTVIYYPVNASNPNESFPYAIFGHGWLVSYSYTQDLTNAWVGLGWIVALPTTEGSLFPSHQNFALDIAFLRGEVLAENSIPTSPLYNKLMPLAVASGYSMGGGSAVLAANSDSGFDGVIIFAAAETNPSAISAASNVIVPSLTFSGSSDNIAPPSQHQIPIFNNLASDYKCYVSLNGATHTNLFSHNLVDDILAPFLSYLKSGWQYHLQNLETVLATNSASLTSQIVNNLIPQTPERIDITLSNDIVNISWDIVFLISGYRIYASANPFADFSDVTNEGSFTFGERVSWSSPSTAFFRRFYYLTAYRN
ncbi:MAG: hypothetical protein R6V77_00500 [Candidatus Cloacimonadaceae bacterium]